MFVLAEFGELTGYAMGQLFTALSDVNKMSLMHVYQLAYSGFKAGARKEEVAFDYTLESFSDLLDQNEGWMEQVFNVLAKSLPEQEEPTGQKKSKSTAKAKK